MEKVERTSARERLTIAAVCRSCGPVDVPVRNLHLWVAGSGSSNYSFICPECREFVRAPVDMGTLSVLLAAAPPFGHDDVHELRSVLQQDDWFHRIERLAPAKSGKRRGPRSRLARTLAKLSSRMSERHRLLAS